MSLKIGILSDTHLGASSIDPELRMDSLETFEESLKTLVGAGADVILHAEDFYDRTDPQPWIHDKATTIIRSSDCSHLRDFLECVFNDGIYTSPERGSFFHYLS